MIILHVVTMIVYFIVLQTLENIKLSQIEKFHKSTTDFERDNIELDPKKIVHQAIENCKPLLTLQKVKRGGVMYQVSKSTMCCCILKDMVTKMIFVLYVG